MQTLERERAVPELDEDFEIRRIAERSPGSEIYGRSLSTIYRLGSYMVGRAVEEAVHSPEAEQAKIEFYTSVEEGFGTDMELGGGLEVRDFEYRAVIDGKVVSRDLKRSISDMTRDGLECAEEKLKAEKARGDSRFAPQYTRSHWDHDNALLVDKMVQGKTDYNTRIVVSPFPEEAAAKSGDAYWRGIGYVPQLKRGFVQLYTMTDKGLMAASLSFDGSDKHRLREIFHKYGVDIPETEVTDNWLQYAITDTLPEDDAKALALEIADSAGDPEYKKTTNTVDVTTQYRPIVDKIFNESYVHACESLARGCQTSEARKLIFALANKAQDFNQRYQKALYGMRENENRFTDDDMIVMHELLVYSSIEMMRAFHLEGKEVLQGGTALRSSQGSSITASQTTMNAGLFQEILSSYGAEGAIHNRTYSACGLSISLGGENDSPDNPQSAFGGLDSKLKWVGCGVCGTKKAFFGDPCATSMKCGKCKSEAKNGVVTDNRKKTEQAEAEQKAAKQKEEQDAKQAQEFTNENPLKEASSIPD